MAMCEECPAIEEFRLAGTGLEIPGAGGCPDLIYDCYGGDCYANSAEGIAQEERRAEEEWGDYWWSSPEPEGGPMKLEEAQRIAEGFCELIRPYCERVEIAGSIRRKKESCNDIDLVLIPRDPVKLYEFLAYDHQHDMVVVKWGQKLASLTYQGAQVDLYFATPDTWATLLLIRTGSKENNIRLCKVAQARRWSLKANGSGLFDALGNRIAGDSEESIYAALGLQYQQPEERE